ncbi:DgyrCDS10967 [Dimorphilus gyrociliatus]|uniref:DgyrCDS10967 n=1 Tax=Dimorphilus gyrociliatus TaxID=2664684 RepID=A0A7I8W313_9ANNE|nr:DgyrCDS10967 [Dimorphilus gyrociliatus]
MALQKLANNRLQNAVTNELSEATDLLRQHNTAIAVISVLDNETSYKTFMDEEDNSNKEIYIADEKLYKDIGFTSLTKCQYCCNACTCCCRGIICNQVCKTFSAGVGGDLRGNILRNGGMLVIKDGEIVLSLIQLGPEDHPEVSEVLKSLGIEEKISPKIVSKQPKLVCNDEFCQIRK